MRRCSVCNEILEDNDVDFCAHRFSICRWCCATGGHNEELPDDPTSLSADDPTSADREAGRYEARRDAWFGEAS